MIDYHCHLLSGLDDGPENIDESVAMAAVLKRAGYKTVYCTPHLIKGCYDADNRTVLSAVSKLRTRLDADNIELEIMPGREYYLDEFIGNFLKHPLPLGNTNYIMIEFSNYSSAKLIKEVCFLIKCGGFVPMIAHPERCRVFALPAGYKTTFFGLSGSRRKISDVTARKTELISYLKEIGCAFQGNIGSFYSHYGPVVRQTAAYFRKKEIFTHFGTDAHSLKDIQRLEREFEKHMQTSKRKWLNNSHEKLYISKKRMIF